MGQDNELRITPQIRAFRGWDRDDSGTLSHAETRDLSAGRLVNLILLAYSEETPNETLPSFFNSLPIQRLTDVVKGAQEYRVIPLFRGLLNDLARRHLSKVACVMDDLIDARPELADGLLLNLSDGFWPSLMTMLEATHPAYVLSRTTLPYDGALMAIDANRSVPTKSRK